MAISIERAEARMLEFTLGDSTDVHRIPLAAYLPYTFVKRMKSMSMGDLAFAIIDEFCPELSDDPSLDLATIKAIHDAWDEASRKDGADSGK